MCAQDLPSKKTMKRQVSNDDAGSSNDEANLQTIPQAPIYLDLPLNDTQVTRDTRVSAEKEPASFFMDDDDFCEEMDSLETFDDLDDFWEIESITLGDLVEIKRQ